MRIHRTEELEKSLSEMAGRYTKVQKALQDHRSATAHQDSEPPSRQVRIERTIPSPVSQGKR